MNSHLMIDENKRKFGESIFEALDFLCHNPRQKFLSVHANHILEREKFSASEEKTRINFGISCSNLAPMVSCPGLLILMYQAQSFWKRGFVIQQKYWFKREDEREWGPLGSSIRRSVNSTLPHRDGWDVHQKPNFLQFQLPQPIQTGELFSRARQRGSYCPYLWKENH